MLSRIQQMIRRNSTNLSLLMSELCSLLCLKLYSRNYAIAHLQKKKKKKKKKKNVTLIRICHNCVALKHKKTDLSFETRAGISFEVIKFVK